MLAGLQTLEWTGGQIKDDDSAEDIKTVDLKAVGTLTLTSFGPPLLVQCNVQPLLFQLGAAPGIPTPLTRHDPNQSGRGWNL